MATTAVGPVRTTFNALIAERSSWRYSTTVTKPDGAALTPAEPGLTLRLTLYVLDAGHTIINGLELANILNAGRGTLSSAGELVIGLMDADNPLVDATLALEPHVMLIQAEWANGGAARHEVLFTVANLSQVP